MNCKNQRNSKGLFSERERTFEPGVSKRANRRKWRIWKDRIKERERRKEEKKKKIERKGKDSVEDEERRKEK